MPSGYLNNQFLIAMPGMTDPNFSQTVTLVCDHNSNGALGIVVNRPLHMNLGEVFAQLGLKFENSDTSDRAVLQGGPVQTDRGFVLHTPGDAYESTLAVSEKLQLTTSRDILDALAGGTGPREAVVALGYAGWESGQLESEMAQNAWLTVEADERLLFDTPPEQRWQAAVDLLGIDLTQLSSDAGHA